MLSSSFFDVCLYVTPFYKYSLVFQHLEKIKRDIAIMFFLCKLLPTSFLSPFNIFKEQTTFFSISYFSSLIFLRNNIRILLILSHPLSLFLQIYLLPLISCVYICYTNGICALTNNNLYIVCMFNSYHHAVCIVLQFAFFTIF